MRRPLLTLVGLLAALGVLLGVGAATTPAPPTARTSVSVPVSGATLVCPQLRRAAAEQLDTRVQAGVVPLEQPAAAGSSVTRTVLGTTGGTALDLAAGTVATGLGATAGDTPGGDLADGALVLTARGGLAAGLQAEQVTAAGGGPRRGLEALACATPQADWWFAGGSSGPGESTTLQLTNPEDTAAVVDVQLWAAEGPVDPRLGRGTVVPPRGRVDVPLDSIAPTLTGLAAHVTTERGRVVAAVEHLRSPGAEWVPPSPAPAARVVLPALPAGPGERSVLITDPSGAATVVQVQVTTGDGQFVPTGLDAVPVPAGTTVRVDLTAVLAGTPAAVVVASAGAPVLAVGRVVDGAGGGGGAVSDLSYGGAAEPLSGPALLTDVGGPGSALLLSAVAGDARVLVSGVPDDGTARTVAVPGGSTVAVPLAGLAGSDGAVLVRPAEGSAPVRAAAYLRDDLPDGPRASLLALVAPVQRVLQPYVEGDPAAAVP